MAPPDQNSKGLALGRRLGGCARGLGTPSANAETAGRSGLGGLRVHLSVGGRKQGGSFETAQPSPSSQRSQRGPFSLLHCTLGFSHLCSL